jgi:hypothetical protein
MLLCILEEIRVKSTDLKKVLGCDWLDVERCNVAHTHHTKSFFLNYELMLIIQVVPLVTRRDKNMVSLPKIWFGTDQNTTTAISE